ncbi:MAG: hypothetical protein JNG82_03640 [Opitutaceae bacterium]|nr:hypothetical protein [Opitutaceae bacterium]
MRKTLTFEAIPEKPSGGLLLQLAVMLRQLNINPESLVWTASPPDGALKIRLVLSEDDQRWLRDIAEHLKHSSGVRDVRCEVVEGSSPLVTSSPGEDQPFTD